MIRFIKSAFWLLSFAFLCLCARAENTSDQGLIRRILVFSDSTSPEERLASAKTSGGKIVRTLDLINAVVIEMPVAQMTSAQATLKQDPDIVRIDEDPILDWYESTTEGFADAWLPDIHSAIKPFKSLSRRHPKPPKQNIPWGIARVNAPAAWPKTRGEGVAIAVIDGGVNKNHPGLKGNIAGGWNVINNTPDFKDETGHGTHVSGIIAAIDTGRGVIGVAPKASIYGVKVLGKSGRGPLDDVIAGMQWAVNKKVQVANMSIGTTKDVEALKKAVEAMNKAGVVLVAAVGNSSAPVRYPAAYPEAIAVAASDINNHVARFSNGGPSVAFVAPGVDIKSTYIKNDYGSLSGTSMAAPHVAGLAALAIAAKGLSGPEAVRRALKEAATALKDVPAEQQGAGIIDAAKLIK